MIKLFTIVWILGLLTVVPYGTYYLFFEASRDQYALIVVLVLFWIFGYWSIVGPLISVFKIRRIMKSLENIKSKDELVALFTNESSREQAINLIASENRIPKFLAKIILNKLQNHYSKNQ